MKDSENDKIKELASDMAVDIDYSGTIVFWPYVFLVELRNRVVDLERKLEEITNANT